jgi:hypothetical protein
MKESTRGRPATYSCADEMESRIEDYFALCDNKTEPYTLADLALFLGFSSRQSLWEYRTRRPEFTDTIEKAKTAIEGQRVRAMLSGKQNTTGAIFDLKCNFGYQDKQQIEVEATYKHQVNLESVIEALGGEEQAREILSRL